MCGFAGFLSFDGAEPSPGRQAILATMGQAIAHRGPDELTYYDDGVLALAFRRLSIVDVAHGRQPFFDTTGRRLCVVNGEIYNHGALRAELASRHRFATASDCEVPLHAYAEWGAACLPRLTGMFALLHWDADRRELFLARDRLGIKPLYLCRLREGLLFASELKGILAHPRAPRDLDWAAMDRAFVIQSPRSTYVRRIDFLPGGEQMTVHADGRAQATRWWSIDEHLATAPLGDDADAYRIRYRELLEQVTEEHLQSEVELGIHLSGGLDSSLLAAIIGRKRKDLPCFTAVERTTWRAGDVSAAHLVTKAMGLPWYPVRFDYRTFLDEVGFDLAALEELVWLMDSPRFDVEWLFKSELDHVARARHPGLKVLIIGQGADEFAGGYSLRINRHRLAWSEYLRDEVAPSLLLDTADADGVPFRLGQIMRDAPPAHQPALSPYHRMMRLMPRQLQHHNLWHEDRTSSWHSLEARVPFLDHRLVELLAGIPESLQATLFWNKQIVRDAMQHFLPAYPKDRPKIGFFETDDTRSIDLLLHGLVSRVLPAFRAKYGESDDFPFDRPRFDGLAQRILQRAPGYLVELPQLLECMCIAIFTRQCHRPEPSRLADAHRVSAPLHVVGPSDWGALDAAFATDPVVPATWNLDAKIDLALGAEVLQSMAQGNTERYVLVAEGRVCSHIDLPQGHPWLGSLLWGIGDATAANRTVREWIGELRVPPEEFVGALDMLSQCGFIRH